MRSPGSPSGITPLAVLAGLMVMSCLSAHAAGREPRPPAPRFQLEAQLSVTPPNLTGQRFELQADLQPRRTSPALESAGFLLKASLVTAGEPVCAAPGFLFGSGFESP